MCNWIRKVAHDVYLWHRDKQIRIGFSIRFREVPTMGINVTEWLFGLACKKVVKRVVVLAIAKLSAIGLEKAGVTVDWQQFDVFLTGALFAGLEMLRNYLKVKGVKYI